MHTHVRSGALPWHAVLSGDVLDILETSRARGLSEEEAARRFEEYGPNELPKAAGFRTIRSILAQLRSPLALVLVVTGMVTILLQEWIDSAVVFSALIINIGIGVIQEGHASKIFEALERSHAKEAVVLRGGEKRAIPARAVVPGDIVILGGGRIVPADTRIIESDSLEANEATLTGEWASVKKREDLLDEEVALAERANMLWSGTTITAGHGLGVVVESGSRSELGRLAHASMREHANKTPLQEAIRTLARTIIIIVLLIVMGTIALGVFRGMSLADIALMAVAISVAAMPEGLPAAVSVVLAAGMKRILRRGGLVKSLLAAETLGSTTVILTDKTGTLTEGMMSASRFYTARSMAKEGRSLEHGDNRALLEMAVLASDAFLDRSDGTPVARGRPIERALVSAGAGASLMQDELFENGQGRFAFLQFEPSRRYAASLNAHPRDGRRVYLSGSPEHLLRSSTHVAVAGTSRVMDDGERRAFMRAQEEESAEGAALIAVAYRTERGDSIPDDVASVPPRVQGLTFVGLIVLSDALRAGVEREIRAAQQAGVRVVMVTGDHKETARAIALQTGIAGAEDAVFTGADIAGMDQAALGEALGTGRVFARITPEEKLRMVEALVARGEVVAMTGDGVNDAPALKAADVGVAVGSGTDVAKEAADIILLDDSFSTITAAIEEGRRIIANLSRVVAYLLSTGLSEVMIIVGALAAGVPLPLLPTQLLWTNIIHEGFMSVPFAFEPASPRLMREPPRGLHERVLTPRLLLFVAFVSVLGTMLLLGFYTLLYAAAVPLEHLRTLVFAALSLLALSIALSLKDFDRPLWNISILSNPPLIYALLGSVAILTLSLTLPFMRTLLSLTPLGLADVVLLACFCGANMLTVECAKILSRMAPGRV